jgi:integrase
MPRRSEGSVRTRSDRPGLWARVTYRDQFGKQRVFQRRVANRSEGKLLLKQKLREIEDHGAAIIEGERLTFAKLAGIYLEKRLFEPTITPSGKTVGLRSYKSVRLRLKTLIRYFGNKLIRAILHEDIEFFKKERLALVPQREIVKRANLISRIDHLRKEKNAAKVNKHARIDAEIEALSRQLEAPTARRTEADVNRDLQLLRNVFNFAVRQGWIVQSPFKLGEPLISMASETPRERVLSREEERRLLAACTGKCRHLRPILVCALDTGMRRGEIFKLCWKEVDLINREIMIRATNTKTGRARVVPITTRLYKELSGLKAVAPPDPSTRVFGVSDIKNSFSTACQIACVTEFQFRDTRHTALTRWTESGMPPMQLMAISGHTQVQTFSRYINADRSAIRRAAEAMDSFHARTEEPERPRVGN